MTVAALTPRVREALSVSSTYDAVTIPAAIRRAVGKLLRDYNFPKTLVRMTYSGLSAGQDTFALPAGFKKALLLQFFDPAETAWGDALLRRDGFTKPQGDAVPRRYRIEGTNLVIDTPLEGGYENAELQMWYQTMDVATCEDWMTADFEDVVYNLTCYRTAIELRKPEVMQAFQQLWAEDRTALAVFLNELEFDGIEMQMREQRPVDTARYPC